MNRKFWTLLVGLLLLPAAVMAQTVEPPTEREDEDNTRFGGTSAVFLTLPADARGAALGGSIAALTTDASSMFYNPAGIALMGSNQAMFSYTPYVADTRHITAAMGWSLRGGEWGLGLSIQNFGFSDAPVYTEDAQEGSGETYSVSSTAVGLTTGLQFSDRFAAGFTVRMVSEQLGRTSGTGFTVDFGTSYHAELGGRAIRASFIIVNYGTPIKQEGAVLNDAVDPIDGSMGVEDQPVMLRTSAFDPPTQFRVGVAYDLMGGSNRLTLLSEFSQPNDARPGVGVGAEFATTLSGGLTAALRGSYSYQGDNDAEISSAFSQAAFASTADEDEGLDGLAAGAGLGWRFGGGSLSLDYAFRHLGVLGTTNMFSVKLAW